MKIVIVGGVAGGASAAAKARRTDEHAEITLFEKGPYVSFANCGLPYFIGGDIRDRDALILQTPESFHKRFRVKVHVLHEAIKIEREAKNVVVQNLQTGQTFREHYDKLILAPGAGAVVPNIAGIHSQNIFRVKTVPDSESIRSYIEKGNCKRALVVGGGFIGLEAAEALQKRGLQVTLVEMLNQVLPPFDEEMAQIVSRHLSDCGVEVILGDGIREFLGDTSAHSVVLQSGRKVAMDLAILSIGVRPELKLAQEAGLQIGEAGGIAVNENQQTSDPDIYAAGDAVEVFHRVTQRKTRIPLAGPANKQGRVAGANAAGAHLSFPGAIGTAIVETLGIVAAKTGLSEKEAAMAGLSFFTSLTHSADHAGYFPGSHLMHMKILVENGSERILGAQIVGESGVDKRIDVLASAIYANLKTTDLENLDLAYAPQFSSAKDPVIMAGFVASNVARREVQSISYAALQARLAQKTPIQLLDVRTPQEYEQGHLKGARLIPVDELRGRLEELDPRQETVVYCKVGLRGYLAARILAQNHFENVFNLSGGLMIYPELSAKNNRDDRSTLSATDLKQALADNRLLVIDVREPDEFRFEHVDKTVNVSFNSLLQDSSMIQKGRPIAMICQTGMRSIQAARVLEERGFSPVLNAQGGLEAWKAAGYPTVKSKGPLPILRQVQMIAGGLILFGAISQLNWIGWLVGAGLFYAGFSGHCGMAVLLTKMPWNKPSPSPKSSGGCGI